MIYDCLLTDYSHLSKPDGHLFVFGSAYLSQTLFMRLIHSPLVPKLHSGHFPKASATGFSDRGLDIGPAQFE